VSKDVSFDGLAVGEPNDSRVVVEGARGRDYELRGEHNACGGTPVSVHLHDRSRSTLDDCGQLVGEFRKNLGHDVTVSNSVMPPDQPNG
jgi:hypothetical protein